MELGTSARDEAVAALSATERALAQIVNGGAVIVADGPGPDNMGMLVMAAEHADVDSLRTFTRLARGILYLALTDERCDELGLELVAAHDDSLLRAPLTVSIAARNGIETGISVRERAHTISIAIDPSTSRRDIVIGGHINPLRGRPGGVLERAGPTEAAVDLARLAGLNSAGLLGEIVLDDGSEAKGESLISFASENDLPFLTIGDLIAHRRRSERLITRIVTAELPTATGVYSAVGYLEALDRREHLALVRGDVSGQRDVLVYVHLACWEGDVFRGKRCSCRARLDAAIKAIDDADRGVIVHLAQDGYDRHQERGHDEILRDFGIGAQILAELGLTTIRVLSDNPRPLPGLEGYGLEITGHQPVLGRSAP
jgi:3,4-dihydroxy 2-butanone 4-phosphate synthase/GTP cyclohydrolase II